MADMEMKLEAEGMKQLQKDLAKVEKKLPNQYKKILVRQSKKLRRDMINLVKNDLDTHDTKGSMSQERNYRLTKVKKDGYGYYTEITGKSKHFHLLENGHQKVVPKTHTFTQPDGSKIKRDLNKGGQNVGYVLGYHFADRAGTKRMIEMPTDLEKQVDKILREAGLL